MSTATITDTTAGHAGARADEPQVILPPTWVDGHPTLAQITDEIAHPLEAMPGKGWWICFGIAVLALLNLLGAVSWLFYKGIGVWGLNNSVGWAFDITN